VVLVVVVVVHESMMSGVFIDISRRRLQLR